MPAWRGRAGPGALTLSHAHSHAHGDHHHGHAHGHPHGVSGRYPIAIALNLGFVVVEAAAGLAGNSTALLADAGHNLSDVMGLLLAGGAAWLAKRPGSERRTYGFGKAGVLAALANALLLVFACGAVGWEAVTRLASTETVRADLITGVAAFGAVLNLGTALLFLRGRKEDVNVRGVWLHMAADAAVSAGVAISGVIIWLTGFQKLDAVAGLAVLSVILWGTWGLLKDSFDLAMDAAPAGMDVREVKDALLALPGVAAVHDMHVWNLSTTETALTAHLVRAEPADAEFYAQAQGELGRRFRIGHATLQVETDPAADCPRC